MPQYTDPVFQYGASMIYFIRDEATKFIKIGYTGGIAEERLRDLQTGCPGMLKIILEIEGSKQDEAALHARFASARDRGEWFRPEPELLLTISDGIIDQLKHEKDQLLENLDVVQTRLKVVRGQLGSLWASMGGQPAPQFYVGFDPHTGDVDQREKNMLNAKIEALQKSRQSLRMAIRNIVDWIDQPSKTDVRPVIF